MLGTPYDLDMVTTNGWTAAAWIWLDEIPGGTSGDSNDGQEVGEGLDARNSTVDKRPIFGTVAGGTIHVC